MRKVVYYTLATFSLFFCLHSKSFAQTGCAWKELDFVTRGQLYWDEIWNTSGRVWSRYNDVYESTFGLFEVGIPGNGGYSIRFTDWSDIIRYLEAKGTPAALNGDYVDNSTTSSGSFGGEVVALKVNVDFSADGILRYGSTSFGELTLHDLSLPALNGMSVSQILTLANTLLGGGAGIITIQDINPILIDLNAAFRSGNTSVFAQQHLTGWKEGELVTYTQLDYGQDKPDIGWLTDAFNQVYKIDEFNSILEIGIPGSAGYSIRFIDAQDLFLFFVQVGTSGILNADLIGTSSSSAGAFGGEVLALSLNVDFSDFGAVQGRFEGFFGDLVLHDLATLSQLNGMSVRQVLAIANTLLGGGSSIVPLSDDFIDLIAFLNVSFTLGHPTRWAQEHLKLTCQTEPVNHPPTATSASVATPVGASITIQLQASDEDNDNLTYTISQQPAHGTISVSASGLATYIPVKGYSGADQFTFQVSDGTHYAGAVVELSIFNCPRGQGYWKTYGGAWPSNTSSMVLGAASYTKAQLLNILDASKSGDASLILAAQLIAAKLNQTDGTPTAAIAATIAHANALLAAFSGKLPYKVKTNTTAGKAMTADAAALEGFNLGAQTPGCQTSQAATSITLKQTALPVAEEGFSLDQNQPNPFRQNSTIRYHLPGTYHVTLKVYDLLGRELQTLVNEVQQAGIKSVLFDGANRPAGVYYYKLTAGPFATVRKMVLTR